MNCQLQTEIQAPAPPDTLSENLMTGFHEFFKLKTKEGGSAIPVWKWELGRGGAGVVEGCVCEERELWARHTGGPRHSQSSSSLVLNTPVLTSQKALESKLRAGLVWVVSDFVRFTGWSQKEEQHKFLVVFLTSLRLSCKI